MSLEATPERLRALTRAVREHIEQHEQMTPDDFDRILLDHKLIDRIPSVMDPARGSHTRTRDRLRERVKVILGHDGLALAPCARGIYRIEDPMIAGMVRLTGLTADHERLANQRLGFLTMTIRNQLSVLAKMVSPEKADELEERWHEKVNLLSQGMAQDLYFVCKDIPWPDPMKALVPKKPPGPSQVRQGGRRKRAA